MNESGLFINLKYLSNVIFSIKAKEAFAKQNDILEWEPLIKCIHIINRHILPFFIV